MLDRLDQEIRSFISDRYIEVYVVDIQLKKGRQNALIIKIDTDEGISLSLCETISRELAYWLDETDKLDFAYRLEVSSPGIGYPIKIKRQYKRNIDKYLRVSLDEGKQIEGKLLSVEDEGIILAVTIADRRKGKIKSLQQEESGTLLKFSEIKESKVIIHF